MTTSAVDALGGEGAVADERGGDGPAATEVPVLPGSAAGVDEASDTRERILEVALELFSDQGYDKTSLREISERVGVTKAALYYHFPSKLAILGALHEELHAAMGDAVGALGGLTADTSQWPGVFDALFDRLILGRTHMLLHERNRAAFEELHRSGTAPEHNDLEVQFRRVIANPSISPRDKVRLACAQGAVIGGVLLSSASTDDLSEEDLVRYLKEAVHDLLGQPASC